MEEVVTKFLQPTLENANITINIICLKKETFNSIISKENKI